MANRFQYSHRVRRVIAFVWGLVLALNAAEYLLAWLRALYGWLAVPLSLPPISFLAPPPNILQMLLNAHLGLAFALAAADALAFLAPRILFGDSGMTMETAMGSRRIPYSALRGLRSVELPHERYFVWVDSARGLPWQNVIASLLFGRWLKSGFLLTSDLAGFDDVVATVVAQLKKKHGEADLAGHFSDEKPTWIVSMLSDPLATVRRAATKETIPIGQGEAAWQMVSVTASLMVPLLVAGIIHLQVPWGALAVIAFAFLEWPLASFYLSGVPIEYKVQIQFNQVLGLYPLTQLPRWFFAAVLTLLVIAGAPLLFVFLATLPAIVAGSYLVFRLTDEWFQVRIPDGLLSIAVTAVWQFVLYLLLVAVLPR